jgi:hypothetical protein
MKIKKNDEKFIENYRGVDIFHSNKMGYSIKSYWFTYTDLSTCKKVIDFRLDTDMKVGNNKGLTFKKEEVVLYD